MPDYQHTLLATLGGQPQVVTFTLDLLLRRDIPIREVIVIHPQASHPRLQHSLSCLNEEFIGDRYKLDGRSMPLRSHMLKLEDTLLDDITDDISANGALDTIHQLIRDLKQQQRCIHLSVTGGRRLMALTAISAAQINFKHNIDHIWHIYTPETIKQTAKDGRVMHMTSEGGMKVNGVPFVAWRTYFGDLPQQDNPSAQAVVRSQIAEIDAQEHRRRKQVKLALTKGQLKVLQAFAEGMNPAQVANALSISPSTVSTHTTKIFVACRNAWNMPEGQPLNYYFLRDKFEKYFDHNG